MASKLDEYRTPANALEGEWLEMDNGLMVRVALPTTFNRKYRNELLKAMDKAGFDPDEDRSRQTPTSRLEQYDLMIDVFNRMCILEIDDPDAPTLPLDIDEWGKLIVECYNKATSAAMDEMGVAEDEVEKPKPT